MKVSVNEADLGDEARWVGLDHVGHQELAELWGSGVAVAAQHGMKSKTNGSGFGVAEAVMVRIDLKRLPLAAAMDAEFTQEHASVAACRQDPLGGGELLLAFGLPSSITDAKTFVRLMAGIETLYAGSSRHASALEPFGLRSPGEPGSGRRYPARLRVRGAPRGALGKAEADRLGGPRVARRRHRRCALARALD